MNRENTKKLNDEFEFFHPELPPTENLMCFGFECDDGWFDLIWKLCEDIRTELKVNPMDFLVMQVKEKFGGLRFYPGFASDKIFDLIDEAEEKSYEICETCGKPGKITGGNWVKTSCEKCLI